MSTKTKKEYPAPKIPDAGYDIFLVTDLENKFVLAIRSTLGSAKETTEHFLRSAGPGAWVKEEIGTEEICVEIFWYWVIDGKRRAVINPRILFP